MKRTFQIVDTIGGDITPRDQVRVLNLAYSSGQRQHEQLVVVFTGATPRSCSQPACGSRWVAREATRPLARMLPDR